MTAFHPYSGNHICAFEGDKAGLRSKKVQALFQKSVAALMKDKALLRNLALDISDGCPCSSGNSIENNGVKLSAYAYKNSFYVECSNTACPNNHHNAVFAFSACKDEPPVHMPGKLLRAVNKEHAQFE